MSFDIAYVDPSRRSDSGKRVILFEDCSPSLSDVVELLQARSPRLLVKASPILDISSIFKEFPQTTTIYVLESHNEVKELLIDMDLSSDSSVPSKEANAPRTVKCVMLSEGGADTVWEFPVDESGESSPVIYLKSSEEVRPGCYVYEPSPSIMKAGGFNRLQSYFPELKKFSPNTHLFMGNELFADFPGKIFKVNALLRSSDLKKMKGTRASVISRNHPAKASELETRYRLKSSDTDYLIAATIGPSKLILSASRLP